MSDPATYRTKEELEKYKAQDSIEELKRALIAKGMLKEAEYEDLEEKIKKIVDDSVKFAEESPEPSLDDIYTDVWMDKNIKLVNNTWEIKERV